MAVTEAEPVQLFVLVLQWGRGLGPVTKKPE